MNIIIFGDSITHGFHDDEIGGWVSRLFSFCVSEMLQSNYEKYVSVFNLGISGERTCDLIKRFDVEFDAREDENMLTIFSIGINDSVRNVDTNTNRCEINEYKQNLQKMITKAKDRGNVILVGLTAIDESRLSPIPWFPEYSHLQIDRDKYDDALKELANENGCMYIPTEDLFLNKKAELLPDGLHPNAAGHRLIYERVKNELKNANIL